jgi:hypothetical protein
MTTLTRLFVLVIMLTGIAANCASAQTARVWSDPQGDAVIRRTDPGASAAIDPASTLPDVIAVVISGWSPTDPFNDPFVGSAIATRDAHIFKIDIVFAGLVNPPGQLGLNNPAFDPYKFGQSPVYGFLDLDVDQNKDTGGELSFPAENRYLANVGRFGRVPYGSIGERAAESADDIDGNFFTMPFYERTGADFVVTLCGCWNVSIVVEGGNNNQLFDAGETWVVDGRFLERSQGYAGASSGFGGSVPGHWDPQTEIQFSHDIASDTTTITVVAPLDMLGDSLLKGEPEEPIDFSFSNHTSIVEALNDIIVGASGQLFGPVFELTRKWKGRNATGSLDVFDWEASMLFGTTYTQPSDYSYAWTDTGFDEIPGDVNADGFANALDGGALRAHVYAEDGGPDDGDGVQNGRVVVINRGINFSLFDLDGDYVVEGEDLWLYGNRADLDNNGRLDVFDFLAFQNAFSLQLPVGDFNLDQRFDIFDFLAFQDAFSR